MAAKLHRSILVYSLSLCLIIISLGPNHVGLCTAQVPSFVYSGFQGADITLDGSAVVQPGGLLQLTNSSDIIGYAFHRAPLRFRHGTVRSFSLSFVFAVQSEFDKESSGGMAFFVAPGKNFSGALPGSFLGLFNTSTNGKPDNRIFVAELDTFGNGEFKDIDSNHVGIDINGLISIEAHTAGFYDDN